MPRWLTFIKRYQLLIIHQETNPMRIEARERVEVEAEKVAQLLIDQILREERIQVGGLKKERLERRTIITITEYRVATSFND